MNNYKKAKFALLSLLTVLASTSCKTAAPVGTQQTPAPKTTISKSPIREIVPVSAPSLQPPGLIAYNDKLFGNIHPVASGTGVLVAEPVVLPSQNENGQVGEFGAACSRWLQFHVGGQGEVGKTPLWSSIASMQHQMARPDLRLTTSDVKATTKALGVTHIALSTIQQQGTADQYRLEFKLINTAVPTAKLQVISLQGSESEILAQLPKQAKTLSLALGVKSPHVPAKINLKPEEMQLLGRGGWTFPGEAKADLLKQVSNLAKREPLAALLALEYGARTDVDAEWQYNIERYSNYDHTFCDSQLQIEMVKALMSQAGENTLSLAEIGAVNVQQLFPYELGPRKLRIVSNKYPYNYALRTLLSIWFMYWGDHKASTDFARSTVMCAPKNPYAWIFFATRFRTEAGALRKGRTAPSINETEWKFLRERYAQQDFAVRKAATLDPQNPLAWAAISEAAIFSGDQKLAYDAFWKAYKLDPENLQHFQWGLQIYQTKWGGDPEALAKIIVMLGTPEKLAWVYPEMWQTLYDLDRGELNLKYRKDACDYLDAQLKKNSDDVMALARLVSRKYDEPKKWGGFAAVVKIRPKSSLANWMAATEAKLTDPKAAIPYYQRAVELDPNNLIIAREAPHMMFLAKQYQPAVDDLLVYIKRNDTDFIAHSLLAQAYLRLDQPVQAAEYFSKTLKLNPKIEDANFYTDLSDLQLRNGKYKEALESARTGSNQAIGDPTAQGWAFTYFAWAFYKLGNLKEAYLWSNAALQLSAEVILPAYACQGEVFLAQGDLTKARRAWHIALTFPPKGRISAKREKYYTDMVKARQAQYPAPKN